MESYKSWTIAQRFVWFLEIEKNDQSCAILLCSFRDQSISKVKTKSYLIYAEASTYWLCTFLCLILQRVLLLPLFIFQIWQSMPEQRNFYFNVFQKRQNFDKKPLNNTRPKFGWCWLSFWLSSAEELSDSLLCTLKSRSIIDFRMPLTVLCIQLNMKQIRFWVRV